MSRNAKWVSCTMLAAFIAFLAGIPAFAAGNVHRIEDLGMSITFPENYYVFTEKTPADDIGYDALGMKKSDVDASLRASNTKLSAFPDDFGYEIYIVANDEQMLDFTDASDTILEMIAGPMTQAMEERGALFLASEIYHHAQIKFIKLRYSFADEASGISFRAIQYYTICEGTAISLNLRVSSLDVDINSADKELKSIVDTIDFWNIDKTEIQANETQAFEYKDAKTGLTFTVPANWSMGTLSKERENFDEKFLSNKEPGLSILYGSRDVWAEMSDYEKTGLSRVDVNQSLLKREEFQREFFYSLDISQKTDFITINKREYFRISGESRYPVGDYELSIPSVYLMHMEDGCLYTYSFGGSLESPYYSDFLKLMESVSYPLSPEVESKKENDGQGEPLSGAVSKNDVSRSEPLALVLFVLAGFIGLVFIAFLTGLLRRKKKKSEIQAIVEKASVPTVQNNSGEFEKQETLEHIQKSDLVDPVSTPKASNVVFISGNNSNAFGGNDSQIKASDDTQPRICPKCGTELPSESIFCHKCGAKIEEEDTK